MITYQVESLPDRLVSLGIDTSRTVTPEMSIQAPRLERGRRCRVAIDGVSERTRLRDLEKDVAMKWTRNGTSEN